MCGKHCALFSITFSLHMGGAGMISCPLYFLPTISYIPCFVPNQELKDIFFLRKYHLCLTSGLTLQHGSRSSFSGLRQRSKNNLRHSSSGARFFLKKELLQRRTVCETGTAPNGYEGPTMPKTIYPNDILKFDKAWSVNLRQVWILHLRLPSEPLCDWVVMSMCIIYLKYNEGGPWAIRTWYMWYALQCPYALCQWQLMTKSFLADNILSL